MGRAPSYTTLVTLGGDPFTIKLWRGSITRNFLTRTHLQDLIETTAQIHYESFRAKQLLALKESSAVGGHSSRPISPSADRELSRNSQRMTMNGY
jgi:septin 3/9/12